MDHDAGIGQASGQGKNGVDGQDHQSQEEEEQDNINGNNGCNHRDSEHTINLKNFQTQAKTQQQEPRSWHKKRKAVKDANMSTLIEDDVHDISTAIAKVTQDNLTSLKTHQVGIVDQVKIHLNKLIEAINEVKATMEADTYGVDPNINALTTTTLLSLIKVKNLGCALEMEVETSAVDDNSTLQIDFSKLALSEVYEVQQSITFKIRLRENVVAY